MNSQNGETEAPNSEPVAPVRRVRADARRNLDTLLRAAMTVFARSGVDAPVREIAAEAGVGLGTIYRHFPTRADLVVGVFRHEIDACADMAPVLAAALGPGAALAGWIDRYVEFLRAKRGLAAALYSGDPAYDALPQYFEARLEPALAALLDAAVAAGEIRAGVRPREFLGAVAGLCTAGGPCGGGDPEEARRMVALLVDGLRHGARRPDAP